MKNLLVVVATMFAIPAFAQVDLRSFDGPIKNFERDEKKGAVYTVTSALEVLARQAGYTNTVIEPDSVYKKEKEIEKILKKMSTVTDTLNTINIDVKSFKEGKKVSDIVKNLDRKIPVIVTFKSTPKDLMKCKETIVTSAKTDSYDMAYLAMGYTVEENETFLLLKNNLGSECGEEGYQKFPLSFCDSVKKIGCSSFTIEKVNIKSLVTPVPTIAPTLVPSETPVQKAK